MGVAYKVTDEMREEIKVKYKEGLYTQDQISKMYGISATSVNTIVRGIFRRRWIDPEEIEAERHKHKWDFVLYSKRLGVAA